MLEDWRSAPLEPKLRATLGLLEKVTLSPEAIEPADATAVSATGVSDQAISDALHVCFSFNLIDRLADSFGWHVQTAEQFGKDAKHLLKSGYQMIGPIQKRALAAG